jgi:carbon-monoxide dehydrogenase small subunit
MVKKYPIQFDVNGDGYELLVEPDKTLLQLLREDLDLTGTKEGCGEGDCGACSVILNGRVVSACLVLAVEADNAVITTIEGIKTGEKLHPIQQAFVDKGAIQCGFCTPGMVVTTKAMLEEMPDASEEDMKHDLSGNLCRCTGYVKILDAVQQAKDIVKES